MKKKVFQSNVKKFLIAMAIMYFIYAIGLYYGVCVVYAKLPKADPLRFPYLIAMTAAGVALFFSTLVILLSNIGKVITLTPQSFEYKQRNKEFKVSWRDLIFKPPDRGKKLYRVALISNGQIFGSIDNIFFTDFETIVKVIDMAKGIKGSGTIELG